MIFQFFLALCTKIRDHDEEYACTRCYCKKLYHFFFQFNLVYTTNMFCYQQALIDRQYEIYIPGGGCFFLVAEEINVTKLYITLSLKSKKVSVYEKFLYSNIRSLSRICSLLYFGTAEGGGQGISVQHSVRMKKKNRSQIRSIRWPNADRRGLPFENSNFLNSLCKISENMFRTPRHLSFGPPLSGSAHEKHKETVIGAVDSSFYKPFRIYFMNLIKYLPLSLAKRQQVATGWINGAQLT